MPTEMQKYQWTIYSKDKPELHAALCKLKNNQLRMSRVLGDIVEKALRQQRPELFEPAAPAAPAPQAAVKSPTVPNTNRTRK